MIFHNTEKCSHVYGFMIRIQQHELPSKVSTYHDLVFSLLGREGVVVLLLSDAGRIYSPDQNGVQD
jgi:hypothetical protein